MNRSTDYSSLCLISVQASKTLKGVASFKENIYDLFINYLLNLLISSGIFIFEKKEIIT